MVHGIALLSATFLLVYVAINTSVMGNWYMYLSQLDPLC